MNMTAGEVVEGMFLWAMQNPWLLRGNQPKRPDYAHSKAASQALRTLAAGGIDEFQRQPQAVKKLAAVQLVDLLSRLMGPMSDASWPVIPFDRTEVALQHAAWRVVEIELLRDAGLPAEQH